MVLTAIPAVAETIQPSDAPQHLGQTVTVEGTVSEVHTDARSGITFINMGGRYPDQAFTGVIFADDAGKFPNLDSLTGKVVGITGRVQSYKGRLEIIITDPAQLKTK
ncbi:MAG TPA: OB-fold nucleic acid binding domain-containing protein [Steroidobacteraceae bacterium]|nr:OB-fold nucleic acid binding domain-containing protein [Steroidobacteraceae bacterium]